MRELKPAAARSSRTPDSGRRDRKSSWRRRCGSRCPGRHHRDQRSCAITPASSSRTAMQASVKAPCAQGTAYGAPSLAFEAVAFLEFLQSGSRGGYFRLSAFRLGSWGTRPGESAAVYPCVGLTSSRQTHGAQVWTVPCERYAVGVPAPDTSLPSCGIRLNLCELHRFRRSNLLRPRRD